MPPANFFSQPRATTRVSSRHRPILHTCGVSMLAIVHIAIGKTKAINGPIGSTFRKATMLAKFATPYIYTMQFQWLTMLSFVDDAILATEKIAEKLFPPSSFVFDKVDEVVLRIVSLPEKFDGAVNKFPTIIHEVPFLDRTLTLFISTLNRLVSLLRHWGHENSRAKEKTIGVDNESPCEGYHSMDDEIDNENVENFPPISEVECKAAQDIVVNSTSHMKGSYKEALERGKEEKMEKESDSEKKITGGGDDCVCEGRENNDGNSNERCDVAIVKNQVGGSEGIKDALLELFESAWLMKAGQY